MYFIQALTRYANDVCIRAQRWRNTETWDSQDQVSLILTVLSFWLQLFELSE